MIICRCLRDLVTVAIEEQDIVYGQTDGRTTDERVSHKLDWTSTSRAKNIFNFSHTIWLFYKTQCKVHSNQWHGVYVYTDLNWHKTRQMFFFCEMASKARTLLHTFRLFQCIRFVKKHLFLSKTTGKGWILDYTAYCARGRFDWTKLANCTSRSCILQHKSII